MASPPNAGSGPLAGVRVLEFAGLGPAPFCAMLLADLGAQVLRVDRLAPGGGSAALFDPALDLLQRGRDAVALDLKRPEGRAAALRLAGEADVLIEGFRPGVMERLGLGPEPCLALQPKLVYGRMTGWGQTGPLAATAGHDINYLALSGALHAIGRAEGGPVPPLNLVADFGGGAMLLAVGVLAAVIEARGSGLGQVVDAAMTDGCALLMAMTMSMQAMGRWQQRRQSNLLDGGAPWYDTYECADGRHLAIGPIEPAFWQVFLERAGLADDPLLQDRDDPRRWPQQKARIAEVLRQLPRDEWTRRFEGSDACVAPVLSLGEAPAHPHHRARGTFVDVQGRLHPAAAPRFSRTPAAAPAAVRAELDGRDGLARWGWSAEAIQALHQGGAMR
ncbi:alpha-methylacyl-CoA racemase [Sphaerotilus hippei]|uniref:Alpha-methylacyl-CoA racemase n=1 Tax=Sphaerotilus hippei TaxID=744406 RepID=A0A318H0Q0_9BURK|nr:CaiB/BaiF CoA-transferase family protein [Sphaerotilus hippei]PXW93996.1 alpha-methylacyl-CoA racemase [Sphaerotilus hippei]